MNFHFSFQSIRNTIDYPLRQLFRWHRSGFSLKHTLSNQWLTNVEPTNQVSLNRFISSYHLPEYLHFSDQNNLYENLYYLEMLESALQHSTLDFPDELYVADIGVSHWFYVRSLFALLRWWQAPYGREIHLKGFEMDAYRIYFNFYSRFDHALAFIKDLPNVEYIPTSFTNQPHQFHIISLLFPFIFLKDHLRWGLPKKHFSPTSLLYDVYNSLLPAGLLIIANQGKYEFEEQQKLLPNTFAIIDSYPFISPFFHYDIPRFITLATKSKAKETS